MRTIAIWLALGALVVPNPGTTFALETPDELTAAEWKCERTAAETVLGHVAGAAECFAECEREAWVDPTRSCAWFFPDPVTQLCLDRLGVRADIQMLRKCPVRDCPDCYFTGCRDFRFNELEDAERFASDLTSQVVCDDRTSVDGLTANESDCQDRILKASGKLADDLRGCLKKCHQRRQKGILLEEACRPDGVTGLVSDAKTQKCIDKARKKFLGSCPACFDPPECWDGSFPPLSCTSAMETTFDWTLGAQRSLFCVDQAVCGDGRISPSEACDFAELPQGCGSNEYCTEACECAPFPDVCAEAEPIPADGGVFQGSTFGPSTTGSFCGGAGPEQVYVWTPQESGDFILQTCNSFFDTVVYVRTDCRDPASEIACNDDFCGSRARLRTSVEGGVTYYVFVDGFFASADGPFELQIMGTSE